MFLLRDQPTKRAVIGHIFVVSTVKYFLWLREWNRTNYTKNIPTKLFLVWAAGWNKYFIFGQTLSCVKLPFKNKQFIFDILYMLALWCLLYKFIHQNIQINLLQIFIVTFYINKKLQWMLGVKRDKQLYQFSFYFHDNELNSNMTRWKCITIKPYQTFWYFIVINAHMTSDYLWT